MTMREMFVTALVIGAGALGFAAASQAGMSPRAMQVGQAEAADRTIAERYAVPQCHLQKMLAYDFSGNPYVKKVRVCA